MQANGANLMIELLGSTDSLTVVNALTNNAWGVSSSLGQLRFSDGHVWVRIDEDFAVLGLSDYLQDQMGEITSLELPDLGDVLRARRRMGHVESEEASSPIEAPISGEVIDVNAEALENPDIVNGEPYGSGWLLRVRIEVPSELEDLISEEEYTELTTEV